MVWRIRVVDHLRLRIACQGRYAECATAVGDWADSLRRDGLVRRLVLDTNEPEVGRCGDGAALRAAEMVFATGLGGVLGSLYEDAIAERALHCTSPRSAPDWEGDAVRRRELLGLLGGLTVLGPIAERFEELRRASEDVLDSPATDRDLDEWERVAWDYSCAVGTVPGAPLLAGLASDFAEVQRLVRSASGSVRTGLLHVMSQLAALSAIAFTGIGEHGTARRWWRTAMRAADKSGELDIAAIVRGRQAVLALYDERPASSVISLAEEGIAVGRGAPRAGVLSSHATIAQSYADLGRHDEARDVLNDLADLFERLPSAVTAQEDSQWGWTEKRLRHVESYVYTRIGDLPRAQAAQARALSLYPEHSYQGRAQVEMHRATTVILSGDPAEGVRHAVRVLEQLPEDRRSDALVVQSASDALSRVPRSMLAHDDVREAKELLGITAGSA